MGIKITIKKEQLPLKYQKYNLIETKDGHTNSVYLMGDKYVLKIFNNSDYNIETEISLLNSISSLTISQIVEYFYIDENLSIVYKQIAGKSIYHPKELHIKQIAIFLKNFHKMTKNKHSSNNMIYTKRFIQDILIECDDIRLITIFNNLNIDLKNDGIIHGDIFCDNVKFVDDKLSGVYDFNEACNGDFLFDLAVIALSWCFDDNILNKDKLNTLLSSYELEISYSQFKEYIKYALLYYATTRYLDNRDYQELLSKLENI